MKLIGLDVGTKRIGAKADSTTKIVAPGWLRECEWSGIWLNARLARLYSTTTFIVGLPRNNSGEETKQSLYVRNFARQLAMSIPNTRIYFEDESLTSVEAENRLKARKNILKKAKLMLKLLQLSCKISLSDSCQTVKLPIAPIRRSKLKLKMIRRLKSLKIILLR